jgi:protein gp37
VGEHTEISWTDHTFNPWHGCFKVSAGCTNCYAETFSKRVGRNLWGPSSTTPRLLFGDKHWTEPLKWNDAAEREDIGKRVFCASMADVFEDHPMLPPERERLWELIDRTPMLDWQLLTKRPENIAAMVPAEWMAKPPANVWYGTSVEDQDAADERIPKLLGVPAVVRFLSCEPLLGPVDLRMVNLGVRPGALGTFNAYLDSLGATLTDEMGFERRIRNRVHWVIAGGESGPKHRPFDPEWARSLRDQCVAAAVPYFFKQVGGLHHAAGGRLLDGRTWDEMPGREAVPA